jgi:hypothetical protein
MRAGSRVLVAIRIAEGGAPSPQEVAKIHGALEPQMMRAGFTFAKSIDAADFVLTASFARNTADPNGGHVTVTSIEPTSRFQIASHDDSTPEGKERRRRLQEIERWVENAWKEPSGPLGP